MLTNKTIELIRKSLELSITNAQLEDTRKEYRLALREFNEYICDLEDERECDL